MGDRLDTSAMGALCSCDGCDAGTAANCITGQVTDEPKLRRGDGTSNPAAGGSNHSTIGSEGVSWRQTKANPKKRMRFLDIQSRFAEESGPEEEEDQCVICQEAMGCGSKEVLQLSSCQHHFHRACLQRYLDHSYTESRVTVRGGKLPCPLCRTEFQASDYDQFADARATLRSMSEQRRAGISRSSHWQRQSFIDEDDLLAMVNDRDSSLEGGTVPSLLESASQRDSISSSLSSYNSIQYINTQHLPGRLRRSRAVTDGLDRLVG